MTQATLSAGQSRIGDKRARDTAAPAHLGALIAAKPRTQGTIREFGQAFFCEQILETRLSEVIETATSTCLSALDSDEQATVKLYVQKAAQAADEASQQTISELQGPGVANPTIASPLNIPAPPPATTRTSQRPERAVSVRRSSKRSFHDTLIGLVSGA